MPREPRWDAVVDSAAKLFSENGFAATSVREVADGAHISKAGLYYHIREKEDLLHRICEVSITAVLESARSALATETEPRAQLAALMRFHIGYFIDNRHNLTVLNREMGSLSPEPRARIASLEREYLELIRSIIRTGQEAGVFRQVDPTVAAFTVLTTMNNLYDWYDPKGKVGPDALVDQITTILLSGLGVGAGGDTT